MNPLKVLWFHMRARVRLCNIWIVVQFGLHRKAPTRLRSKLVKYAGWLEATVLNATSSESGIESNTRDAIAVLYEKLQSDMAKLQQTELSRSLNKEDIDSIKDSFLHLLDLCGIKDADIPTLTEPVPLRHTQQTLITSFGIMSKSLNGGSAMTTPPQRTRRHIRRDPASYADMLIEQLMADASPDSDTSPPSTEESSSKNIGDSTPSSSNALSDPQSEEMLSHRVQPLTLRFDTNPSIHAHHPSSPASDARYGWEEDNLALPSHPHHHHHHLLQTRPASDSGLTGSGSSHTIGSCATMSPPIQEETLTASKSNPNTTSGSTPELPAVVAASSQSLDIPFASFFGQLDNMNSPSDSKPLAVKTNVPSQNCEASSSQHNCYNFPLKYSHSYARELQLLETEMFSDLQLEPDYIPSPKSIPKTSTEKSSINVNSHYVCHEPLVVILPEKGLSKEKDGEKQNYNLNNNYKPSLEDKNAAVKTEENSPKPPIPPRVPLTTNTNNKPRRLAQFVVASEPNKDIGNVWLSHKTTESSSENSPCNMSWSYIDSPPQQVPSNSIVSSMSTGKAHVREKKKTIVTRQATSPFRPAPHHTPSSASKRRKANDKSPMPIEHSATSSQQRPTKSVRQRLFISPTRSQSPLRPSMGLTSLVSSSDPSSPTSIPGSPMTPRMERVRKNKRHSPAMRRLMQEKENNLLSSSKSQSSPRKPFSDVYNIQLNESDPLTTSSNSLSPSSENYAKSSETSPDMPLPSREEELLDRNAYYEDFTVDRDHKFDSLTPAQKKGLLRKGTHDNFYTLKDPSSDEILVRQVEGAESSPHSRPIFQAPLPNSRAPRTTRMKRQSSSQKPLHPKSTSSSGSRSSSPTACLTSKYNLRKKRPSSASRRSSSSGSCSSHPMASSTLIMEVPVSPEKDEETGSVYTWSIEEGSETCNLERSFLRSQSERKNRNRKNINNPQTPRPPTNVGRDSSDISDFEEMNDEKCSFEITAMVSAIDCSSVLYGKQVESFCDMTTTPASSKQRSAQVVHSLPRTSTRSTIPGKGIVSAAPNLKNRISKGTSSTGSSTNSIPSSSNQLSTPSAPFNRAKGSIHSIPTSSSDEQNDAKSENNLKGIPRTNLLNTVSASAPDLARHFNHDDIDASHSLEPSDTDSTQEVPSSVMDDRSDIPGKSNSSGSSSCTAARCRPRVLLGVNLTDYSKIDSKETTLASNAHQQSDQQQSNSAAAAAQDLMDSILTDSPKSVDSSGIFAPYNSYNSPAESVGSHNGYSSTVSSSVPSSDNYYPVTGRVVHGQEPLPPPATPAHTSPAPAISDDSVFKRPFSPAPHVDRATRTPITRSQGVTATASSSSTPTRPMSVRSDPLADKTIFAVPPGVVTGPPKISNKKSLVKKLKRFSTNFYKKGEKIQTLTYL